MDQVSRILSSVKFDGLSDLVALGGPVVVLLLVLSIAVVTIALAKVIGFAIGGVGRHRQARAAIRLYHAGNVPGARRRASAGTVSAAVVRYAIDAAAAMPADAARDATEQVAVLRLHGLRRMIGLLDMIAQIAPLLGLFGTVLGMIEAFRVLEGQGATVDPSALAGGIWVALLTTAVGLAVAMPASVLASWFEGRIENEEIALQGMISALFTGLATPDNSAAGPAHGSAPRRSASRRFR